MVLEPKRSGTLTLRLIVGLALLGCPRIGAAAPTISGYAGATPANLRAPIDGAPPYTPVLILGANLGTSGTVAFNGIPAWKWFAWSPTEIMAIVPPAPSYPFGGPVTVTTNGQTAQGPEFTITPPPAPTISGYAGTAQRGVPIFSASPGAAMLILGTNLGTSGTVAFNGIAAPPAASWSPTAIVLTVPAAPSYPFTGPVTVTTYPYGQTVKGPDFTITPPLGTWSVISLPQQPGNVISPGALAADGAGNLYVADGINASIRIEKRDAQGNWSLIATAGDAPGQVNNPLALAVDAAGNLYVAGGEIGSPIGCNVCGRVVKRDAQGSWSDLFGDSQLVYYPTALALDGAGNLYVADLGAGSGKSPAGRIQKRDVQGNWSAPTTTGEGLGYTTALAADTAGNLYVAGLDYAGNDRIQQRDAQGNWSVVATGGDGPGQVDNPQGLAVDAAGNLYVADLAPSSNDYGRIQKRDAQGNWSVIAIQGKDLGQVNSPSGLAVDTAGNLYVADRANNRVQKYTPGP